MTLSPILYRLHQRFGTPPTPQQVAAETVTVCPAETVPRPPAWFLPGQLDHVRGYPAMSDPEAQRIRISEGEVTHGATMAYRLDRAALLGGYVFAGGARHQMIMDRAPFGPRHPRALQGDVSGDVALIGTPVSDIYFGHYLMDDSATALLAQEFGTVRAPFGRRRSGWTHAHDYRRMMDINVPELGDTALGQVWLFDDIGMNSNRRQRMQQLRERLRPKHSTRSGHGVFIIRARSGQVMRHLENETELADELARRGFEIVDPMQETAADLVQRLSGSALAVSVEGSALTHAYLTMQDRGAMIAIQPPWRFDNVWKDFTDLLGMRYGFVLGEGGRDSFRVDIADVLRTIDLILG
ncbi:glycosyltransferase 61 family protein [Paracoccus zhejiangensis]|uniref:Glycosyltransferase 61 catalytic domain-containing protein n=1 Tax=Paracoccus zhejiangensis TaxID=1077935 RepID=A0A2H5EWY6_9RHOB|nr:glycosyltransferase family 61 protein [Paracoccus zhejiangensis]AUH63784.1 hypothetical protein CX676_06105 [Paracoccus zhejiangensis]